VQRGNPEIQRRAQEVIDRCWQMGEDDIRSCRCTTSVPVALSNALPELAHDGRRRRACSTCARAQTEEPGMSPAEIWCNESQERYVLAIPPSRIAEFQAMCERERCPFAVVGEATGDGHLTVTDRPLRRQSGRHADGSAARQAAAHDIATSPSRNARRRWTPPPSTLKDAAYRVLRLPAVADKTFLITIGDRSVGGMTARDQMVGPWQVPVADVAVTTMAVTGRARRSDGDGRAHAARGARRAGFRAHGHRRGADQPAAADVGALADVKLSANWMAPCGVRAKMPACTTTVEAVSDGSARRSASRSRSARIRCRCAPPGTKAASRSRSSRRCR
jgi:phosphoribosylformylglycinamidine synthase